MQVSASHWLFLRASFLKPVVVWNQVSSILDASSSIQERKWNFIVGEAILASPHKNSYQSTRKETLPRSQKATRSTLHRKFFRGQIREERSMLWVCEILTLEEPSNLVGIIESKQQLRNVDLHYKRIELSWRWRRFQSSLRAEVVTSNFTMSHV